MNIYTNEKIIKRNTQIARYSSMGGLVVLILGMVVSFGKPELVSVSFGALLIGFILSQVGIFYTNRWGRRPRPDELLNKALKGLDGRYSVYHYLTPVAHLLVGPSGVWVLLVRHQRGEITFAKGRWKQRGGGFMQTYLRLFAQEGLGRPDLEIPAEIESAQKYLREKLGEGELPDIQAALVFFNDKAELKFDNEAPSAPTLMVGDLKDFIRKTAKGKPISAERAAAIQGSLPQGEVTQG